MTPVLKQAVDLIARFPGIGRKTAQRIAFYLIGQNDEFVEALAHSLLDLKRGLKICKSCFDLSEDETCRICRDQKRDHHTLCVVEDSPSVAQIERSGSYDGCYHVLQGVLSPVHGIGPGELRIRELLERLKSEEVHEVIIATNPTVEGEATALYLADLLAGTDLKITRIATGIPAGSSLDYIDDLTMSKAFEHRREV
ncbi:MAG: recombination protein RecR [Acidobacteria bacterium]|nr:MAG: recombination protein RecR [Acidobacteriota bacterium]